MAFDDFEISGKQDTTLVTCECVQTRIKNPQTTRSFFIRQHVLNLIVLSEPKSHDMSSGHASMVDLEID